MSALTTHRLRVEIRGAVQGVGFRPFVYRLARGFGLAGWVINDTRGVFIEAEGARDVLERFLARLREEHPVRARIHALDPAWLPGAGRGVPPSFPIVPRSRTARTAGRASRSFEPCPTTGRTPR